MPQSLAIGAFVLGAVLLLISLLSGGFKIFGAEVSGSAGTGGRVVAFLIGIALLGVGFSYQESKLPTPAPLPAPLSSATPAPTPAPMPGPVVNPAPVAVGFPSGYGMQVCACRGVNPAPLAPSHAA